MPHNSDGAVLKPHLDENLPPIVEHTIAEWNQRFSQLSRQPGLVGRDIFALTGHYVDPQTGVRYRASLDTARCQLTNDMALNEYCDIDSVLGVVTGDFPIANGATFKYFMIPSLKHTLTSNLHLPGIQVLNGDDNLRAIHTVPNARFGEIGEFLVCVAFPGLRDKLKDATQPNYVGDGYLQALYDGAIRPAASEVLPDALVRTWPAQYSNEMFRAAPHRRQPEDDQVRGRVQPQQTGRDVHSEYLNNWLAAIRNKVAADPELSFACGMFFIVEAKGMKNRNMMAHLPPEPGLVDEDGYISDPENGRTVAVNTLLRDFDTTRFEPGRWLLDIATTIDAELEDEEPVSLFPNIGAHPEMINHFSGKPMSACQRWVRAQSGGYATDAIAQINSFAGFRISFDEPGDHGIRYLQGYTTDKSVTYHIDGLRRAKRTSAHGVLSDWRTERQQHFNPLRKSFYDASVTHSVAVRFESRVPYEGYPHVHHGLPLAKLKQWLLFVPDEDFWLFKANRIAAICNVLERVCASPLRRRFSLNQLPEVGSLVVTLVWMANALVNRPDSGGYWDEVRDSGSVHVESDGVVVPCSPLGYFATHSLYIVDDESALPRFSSHRVMRSLRIIYLCSDVDERGNELSVWRLFTGMGTRATTQTPTLPRDPWNVDVTSIQLVGGTRRANKQRRVTTGLLEDVPDAFIDTIPQREHDRYESEDEDQEEREEATSLSQQVTNIVYTMPVQVFAKVPNRKARDESWCTLTADQRSKITFSIFCDTSTPGRVFTSWTSFGRDPDKWEKTVNSYFPTTEERASMSKIQGLFQLGAWQDWEMLLASVDHKARKIMVKQARNLVNKEWRWLPCIGKNHLWPTGSASGKAVSSGSEKGGPWIVFNPRFR